MEYGICAAIVAVFIVIYVLTAPRLKPKYYDNLDDVDFAAALVAYAKGLIKVKKGSQCAYAKYMRSVKISLFTLSSKRYEGVFDDMIERAKEAMPSFKIQAEEITKLPSVDGEARAIKVARFMLAHNSFEFERARADKTFDEVNKFKTLSFDEIDSMNSCAICVLAEQLCYALLKARTLAKAYRLAERFAYSPSTLAKKWKKLTKSPLFLSMCATNIGYRTEFYKKLLDDVLSTLIDEVARVCETVTEVKKYDFSIYYTPLEVYDKFDVFHAADGNIKRNFLKAASEICERENLDEYMLAIRLENYMRSASGGHLRIGRLTLFGVKTVIIRQRKDLTLLAAALTSRTMMDILFGARKKSKSVSKSFDFENTFEPIYKFNTVNFGISTTGDRLRLSPNLPMNISEATVRFCYENVEHTLKIIRGDVAALYLGDMRLIGTDEIHLGNNPLDITVVIPK